MLTRFSLGLAGLLALTVLPGCGSRPACVIDTDCPLGQFCSTDMRCELVGGDHDSGVSVDAARSDGGDAGSTDAARDAPAVDVGPPTDTGASDTGAACTSLLGTYNLTSSPVACPTTIATITLAAGASSCEIVVTSGEKVTFGGTMTSTGGGRSFDGTLSIGTSSFPGCMLTFPMPGTMSIDCGAGCVLPAVMP